MDKKKASQLLFGVGGAVVLTGIGVFLYQQYKLTEKLCYGASGFKVRSFGLDRTSIEIMFDLENKGDLDIELRRMGLDVYANDVFIARIDQTIRTKINPRSSTQIPVQITFSPRAIFKNLGLIAGASSMDNIRWRFKGSIVASKFGLPIPIPYNEVYTTQELRTPSPTSVC